MKSKDGGEGEGKGLNREGGLLFIGLILKYRLCVVTDLFYKL